MWAFDSILFQLTDFFSSNEIESRPTLSRLMQRGGFLRKNSQIIDALWEKGEASGTPTLGIPGRTLCLFPWSVDQPSWKCDPLSISRGPFPAKKRLWFPGQLSSSHFWFTKVKDYFGRWHISEPQVFRIFVNLQRRKTHVQNFLNLFDGEPLGAPFGTSVQRNKLRDTALEEGAHFLTQSHLARPIILTEIRKQ